MAKKKEVQEEVQAVDETEEVNYNYGDIVRESLMKTGREGILDLITFMREIGYFKAACSGGNHLCKEGGLAEHSVNVMWTAGKISASLIGDKNITKEMRDSIVIVSLLHDLGKCGQFGKEEYVPNVLKSGNQSNAKPFKRNPELLNVPHSIRSVVLATLFIDLTEEEQHAILYHDGLYTPLGRELQGNETELYLILHTADMWCSRFLEGKKGEENEQSE